MPEPSVGGRISFAELLADARERLQVAGIETAFLDARVLLTHVSGRGTAWLMANSDARADAATRSAFANALARRLAREPVSHITGVREFWSMDFAAGPDVLTPRPDSETLVQAVLAGAADHRGALRVLDLGTGSGCLLLSILSELPNATGVGVDCSEAALRTARINAERLGLSSRSEWIRSAWGEALDSHFDIVISNPPYIPSGDIDGLEPEVAAYEPRLALDGGRDGLDAYRQILTELHAVMNETCRTYLEHGAGQSDAIARLATDHAMRVDAVHRDLSGRRRVIVLLRELAE